VKSLSKLVPVEHAKKVKLGEEDAQEIVTQELKSYLKPTPNE
jgi:hypothetical protein